MSTATVTTLFYFQLYRGLAVYDAGGTWLGTVAALRVLTATGELRSAELISGLAPPTGRWCDIDGFLMVRRGWRGGSLMVPLRMLARVTDAGIVLARSRSQLAAVLH